MTGDADFAVDYLRDADQNHFRFELHLAVQMDELFFIDDLLHVNAQQRREHRRVDFAAGIKELNAVLFGAAHGHGALVLLVNVLAGFTGQRDQRQRVDHADSLPRKVQRFYDLVLVLNVVAEHQIGSLVFVVISAFLPARCRQVLQTR
jgi:hypothetical protein